MFTEIPKIYQLICHSHFSSEQEFEIVILLGSELVSMGYHR